MKIILNGIPIRVSLRDRFDLEMTEPELNSFRAVFDDLAERLKGYGVYRVAIPLTDTQWE